MYKTPSLYNGGIIKRLFFSLDVSDEQKLQLFIPYTRDNKWSKSEDIKKKLKNIHKTIKFLDNCQ